MRRFFAKNLLFILGINILVKPLWIFLIDRTVQNRVGHASYGTFQALLNMSVIMQFVLDFGLNSYNTRTISASPDSFKDRFPVMLALRLSLMVLYAVAVISIGYVLGYRAGELKLLCGTLLIQTLTMLLLFVRSNVAAFQHFKLDGVLSVADRLLMIIVCGALLFLPAFAGRFRIEWFVWTQVTCYAIAIIIGFYFLWRITQVPLRLSFHFEKVGYLLREAAPYALLIFLMSVYMRSDTTLVERLASKEEAGIYAAAYRQLDVCNMFAILFAGILLPLFARMLSEGQDVGSIVRLSANLLLPFSVLGAVVAWSAGEGIMHLLYPGAGEYDGRVFAWIMSCLPAYSLMYIYSTLLTANGALRLLNMLAAGAVMINLGLNFFVIPLYGALGAAMVACITQWSIAISSVIFAARQNNLPRHPSWIGAHVSYTFLLSVTGFAAYRFLPHEWMLKTAWIAVVAGILIFLFRFISFSQLRRLLLRR